MWYSKTLVAMMKLLVLLCTISVVYCDLEVTLTQGSLKGKLMTSRSGRNISAFQGIPYAKPPIGNLRFQPPRDAEGWEGVRLAQDVGSKCAQFDWITNTFVGSEDCLFINVYSPQTQFESNLCVMIWFHGGSFYSGSGNSRRFSPELLLDHDIILVTANYRLDALGFLSLGTPEAPGNYGLKDQVAVLRWVQKNINKFGGNPECVTIFGESAGGASVNYLMLSPLARGLFHRAIVQSGSALSPWAFIPTDDASYLGRDLARRVGCENETSMLACLKDVEFSRFPVTSMQIRSEKKVTSFLATIEVNGTDDAFLTETPHELLARGDLADVPLMAGCVSHEALYYLAYIRDKNLTLEQAFSIGPLFAIPTLFKLPKDSPNVMQIYRGVLNLYTRIFPTDGTERLIQLMSDLSIVLGMDEMVRDVALLGRSPVYYYQFSYDGGRATVTNSLNLTYNGAGHMDELGYMFGGEHYPSLANQSLADLLTIDRVTKLWTNFAKTGNPTPDDYLGVQWLPVLVEDKNNTKQVTTKYLDIGEQLVMSTDSFKEDQMTFFQTLLQSFVKSS